MDIPWAAIITPVAALSGVWLQSFLSRRQTFSNRLWDLQREAYGEILTGLTEAEHHAADLLFILDNRSQFAAGPGMLPTREFTQLLERYSEAAGATRRRVAKDRLILPPRVVSIYDEFAEASRKLDIDPTVTAARISILKGLIASHRVRLEEAAKDALKQPR